MKNIDLKICGFSIGIFFKTESNLFGEIEFNFKKYLSKNLKHIYDSKIIIKDAKGPILYKKNKYFFISLFTRSNNVYYTFSFISIFQIQYIILYILENLLLNKGFILHASSVYDNKNNAYVFLGRQGIGKSTIANKLSNNYEILSDDSICIRKIESNYYCYQLPILESELNVKKTNKMFKLKKVLFLKRGKKFFLEKIELKKEVFRKMKYSERKFFLDLNKKNLKKNCFIMKFNSFFLLHSSLKSKIRL